MLKWTLRGLALFALIILALVAINWNTIQRISKVNSMFDEDKIVHNFSHMDEVLFTQTLPASAPPFEWGSSPAPLPETVTIGGEKRNLSEWLEESATTSLLVIKGDDIVFEQYYLGTKPEDRRISWSVAKSFMSALIGTGLERGEIKSLEDKVIDYAPMLADSAYKDATIRDVLHMSSGVNFNEDYLDYNSDINRMGRALAFGSSMDDFAASLKISDRAPGTGRLYVSIDTHVLGMVMRGATGRTIHDLFTERLWSQIGPSSDAYYMTDKGGRAFVLGGLNITTRDYALFGKLYRDGGQFEGRQVIPADWAAKSVQNSAPADVSGAPFGYGYQWWIPAKRMGGDFYANGIYGQTIYINPEADMVIVKTSAHREFLQPGQSGQSYKTEFNDVCQSLAAYFKVDERLEEYERVE